MISDLLRQDFANCGYSLRTSHPTAGRLIEVYPHPALVELFGAKERLPYKALKVRKYWPEISDKERRLKRLFDQWDRIIVGLETKISGVAEFLPRPEMAARGAEIKSSEDMLDAVICAWVGICVLEDRATPYGDEDAAIWIPTSVGASAD